MNLTATEPMQSKNLSASRRYAEHVAEKLRIYWQAMELSGFDQLIIGSGSHNHRFRDDCFTPYFANAYFEEFVWLPERPNSFLVIEPGATPILHVLHHDDYWHSEPEQVEAGIFQCFDVREYGIEPEIVARGKPAYLGPDTRNMPAALVGQITMNPDSLLVHIDYHRAWKTEYEKDCLRAANQQAVAAHRVAEKHFRQGDSEYDIHMAYLKALACREADLPYDNIVGINEHAAVLHHMHLSVNRPVEPRSMLIDAGARHRGYAADITRTYCYSDEDTDFAALISGVDSLQLEIVHQAQAGTSYTALHLLAHQAVGNLLVDSELISCWADEALENGLVSAFFPHGIGHLLGVQVHDQGGHMVASDGTPKRPPVDHPFLRLTRDIEEGMAFTIEPGLYFIPKLLEPWRGKGVLNELLIDKLAPFGGVRIEDNIIAGKTSVENLTRSAFADRV